MRVLFFSKAKKTTQATEHMMTALRRHPGITSARCINYKRRERFLGRRLADCQIRAEIRRFKPDLTLVNNKDIRTAWLELCRSYGVTSCVYHEYRPVLPDDQVDVARRVEFLYLASEKQVSEFRRLGARRVRLLCRGCSRDSHYPISGDVGGRWRSDVAFIGKPRAGIRQRIIEAVTDRFDLKLWGPGWRSAGFKSWKTRVRASHYRKICAGSGIMLGINDGGAETMEEAASFSKYTSNRTRVTLACGGFMLTNYNDGLEEIFEPGKHLDFYASIEECLAKIEYYLARPEERSRIAASGSAYVRANMTFDHFANEIVSDALSLGRSANVISDRAE